METILFYSTRGKYGCFSNFSNHGVEVDESFYPTVEHYYQSQKFFDIHYRRIIRLAETPKQAAILGRSREIEMRPDWDKIRDEVMYKAVYAKFSQNRELKNILLSTGDALLVENSPIDYYWGCGRDGSGENKLGLILMKVREELKDVSGIYSSSLFHDD